MTASASAVKQSRPPLRRSHHRRLNSSTALRQFRIISPCCAKPSTIGSIHPHSPATQRQPPHPARLQSHYYSSAASSSGMVLTTNTRLVWADVAHLFPPKRDVERIFGVYLSPRDGLYHDSRAKRSSSGEHGSGSPVPRPTNVLPMRTQTPSCIRQGISRSMVAEFAHVSRLDRS